MLAALNTATDCLNDGEVVCIFAEGEISRTGETLPFRKGMERIMKGVEAPIIPVFLDKVWGSIFSFERGKLYLENPAPDPLPRRCQLRWSDGAGLESLRGAQQRRRLGERRIDLQSRIALAEC